MAVPFWLFRNAGDGTPQQRRANYRYNRDQRKVLPFFLLKWLGLTFCLLQAMWPLSQVMASTRPGSAAYFAASMLCMMNGIAFAFACVVITLLLAGFVYLSLVEE